MHILVLKMKIGIFYYISNLEIFFRQKDLNDFRHFVQKLNSAFLLFTYKINKANFFGVFNTWILSPGLHWSTRSFSQMTSTARGSCPVGAFSGNSWMVNVWWSRYVDKPNSVWRLKIQMDHLRISYFTGFSYI